MEPTTPETDLSTLETKDLLIELQARIRNCRHNLDNSRPIIRNPYKCKTIVSQLQLASEYIEGGINSLLYAENALSEYPKPNNS